MGREVGIERNYYDIGWKWSGARVGKWSGARVGKWSGARVGLGAAKQSKRKLKL